MFQIPKDVLIISKLYNSWVMDMKDSCAKNSAILPHFGNHVKFEFLFMELVYLGHFIIFFPKKAKKQHVMRHTLQKNIIQKLN